MTDLYFNNAFSKKPLQEIVDKMLPFLTAEFENSLTESEGAERARAEITNARAAIAGLMEAQPQEIYFVSSGTEANNWALKGTVYANRKSKNHVVLSAIEHFSVYQSAQFMQRDGIEVTFVPVSSEGFVDPDDIAEAIRPSTVVISVQSSSDEIGVIQNIARIASLKERFPDVLFHTDAIQFICYEDFSVRNHRFDLVSLSCNAIYGPPGIAALYIRNGTRITPLLHGGMQEDGMRPGLQSIALIAGFGEAAQMNLLRKKDWKEKLLPLQQSLFEACDDSHVLITGSRTCRTADNIHFAADVDGEALLTLLLSDGIRASSGSTCYQYAQKESHVLKALGFSIEHARGSVLFTLSKDHDQESVKVLIESLQRALQHLRKVKA
jgi:cysteine desulfurase